MAEKVNQRLNPIIGTNIRRLHKERNLKAIEIIAQLQFREVNVTTGIFSKVKNGRNNPNVDMLIALVEIFNCNFDEFFKQ